MNNQTESSNKAASASDTGIRVFRIAAQIAKLDPGPTASLRRGPLSRSGSAAFWQLMAENGINTTPERAEGWAALVQAIAVLTPKGRHPGKRSAHAASMPMGTALYRAGISDLRLARLLTAKGSIGRDLAVRTCRRLAAADAGPFDLRTLAVLVLFDDDRARHDIARHYYRAATAANSPQGESS